MSPRTIDTLPNGIFKGDFAITEQDRFLASVIEGDAYFIRVVAPDDSPIEGGGTLDIVIVGGDVEVNPFARLVTYSGREFKVEFFANPTFTPNTPHQPTPFNKKQIPTDDNQEVFKSSSLVYYNNPTISNPGTALDVEPEHYFGSASGSNVSNDSIPDEAMQIFPANGTTLIRITNNDNSDGRFQYQVNWIEKNFERVNN